MSLAALPTELLLQIIANLSLKDIVSLRTTSKDLSAVTYDRSVWYDVLHRHIVAKGIPVHGLSGRSITSLSSAELERTTIRAFECRRNWTSSEPLYRKRLEIRTTAAAEGEYSRTFSSWFLPGRDNRWLLTFTRVERLPGSRHYLIQCWDLQATPSLCIATHTCADLVGIQVNSERNHVVFTITRDNLETESVTTFAYGIDFEATIPQSGIYVHHSFATTRTSLKLEGSTLSTTDETNRIYVYDVDAGSLEYILRVPQMHNDQTVFSEEHRCHAVLILNDFIVTFCQQWTYLYALPPDETHTTGERIPAELNPIAQYRWAYRIDAVKVRAQSPHPLFPQFNRARSHCQHFPPICILLRFDSWFPWPVNILHHFILPSNPRFDPETYQRIRPGGAPLPELPYLHSVSHDIAKLKPYVAASIPSPIRLFTPSDMVIGPYGTAIWIDAQTDPISLSQAGDRGQRIAGRVLRFVERSPSEVLHPRHAVDLQAQLSENDVSADHIQESGEMLFHLQTEEEEWGRVAVCEDEGRLAVSCVDGRVIVYDYT